MLEVKITNLLENYGVNARSVGFCYTVDILVNVYHKYKSNIKYTLKELIEGIAIKTHLSTSTIKASIRYAVTTHNKYGGGLMLKNLEKILIEMINKGEI